METIARADLIELLQEEHGFSRQQATLFLEKMFELFIQTLEQGKSLKISGFGTFAVRDKATRLGRNPLTGKEAIISARRVPFFRPSRLLRDSVNGRPSAQDAHQ
ncbi:integration host factor subunit alpha [Parasaccharibacter sp. TMW2.1882]|uniref:Integration host factor subunit alpha n=2 Tax=Acetobacteraceae TaxID=433 RepID=A0A7U7G5W3_9PROT|nr:MULTISPECIES: integration host factor subunit alpha [Acetobacteraceae]MCL1562862.1 integration host factor subunit alpha [Parasaccharibacter sp. TMW 2.1886]MCQ0041082.1 integration host factor subunit alpha [Bombella sp.]MUH02906.1 integration host factor subunit alpha [Bombella sp. ESL0387]QGT75241.1 integration host factor subunit alpha [Bombella sp. ESL0368]MBE1723467.1 integration host factor subunit alpha [Bombella apis]